MPRCFASCRCRRRGSWQVPAPRLPPRGKCRWPRFPFSEDGWGVLLAHHLDDDAFAAPAVEFGVVDLLPGAEIQLALGHGHNHLVMHQKAFQVRVAVSLPGAMVAVIAAEGRQV